MDISTQSLALSQARGNHCCPKTRGLLNPYWWCTFRQVPSSPLEKQSHSQWILVYIKKKRLLHTERRLRVKFNHPCSTQVPWNFVENPSLRGWESGSLTVSLASGPVPWDICQMMGCIWLNCRGGRCLSLHDVYIRRFFFTSVSVGVGE